MSLLLVIVSVKVKALIRMKGQKQPLEEFYQKKMFLKVLQISQEKHLVGVSL